jgi:hypothetical protein
MHTVLCDQQMYYMTYILYFRPSQCILQYVLNLRKYYVPKFWNTVGLPIEPLPSHWSLPKASIIIFWLLQSLSTKLLYVYNSITMCSVSPS